MLKEQILSVQAVMGYRWHSADKHNFNLAFFKDLSAIISLYALGKFILWKHYNEDLPPSSPGPSNREIRATISLKGDLQYDSLISTTFCLDG